MRILVTVVAMSSIFASAALAQETGADQIPPQRVSQIPEVSVPRLIRYTGTLTDLSGKALTGTATVEFAIYQDPSDENPMWQETQSIELDAEGRYSALLGASRTEGLPTELFSNGQARWLSVHLPGASTQPRTLLVAVPYALKAADADTLGGFPASAFALWQPHSTAPSREGLVAKDGPGLLPGTSLKENSVRTATLGGTGATGYIPIWTNATTLADSLLFQKSGLIGMGTTSPGAALDILGKATVLRGTSSGAGGIGVLGNASAPTGLSAGVYGETSSNTTNAAGVNGVAKASTGQTVGVWGLSASTSGTGVLGNGAQYGVVGTAANDEPNSSGVLGEANAVTTTFAVYGVQGVTSNSAKGSSGVSGSANASTGLVDGVSGYTSSSTTYAAGVSGYAGSSTGQVYGVSGSTNSTADGAAGVNGYAGGSTGGISGVQGSSASPQGYGVIGTAPSYGVIGNATASSGVTFGTQGTSQSPDGVGVQGNSVGVAVAGFNQSCSGSICTLQAGIAGRFVTGNGGTILEGLSGSGSPTDTNEVFSVDSSGTGTFAGDLYVTGKLTKGSGSFKIDHPLDPANKFLSHSFVESPDMMNVYNGNIATDKHGFATVTLPDYFEALNRDFRYQLTVVGQFAQAIVAKKVANNQFVIRTDKPSVEVSWQITGIRQDAYANANRIAVEESKPDAERGFYLHPELFGQPASRSLAGIQRLAESPGLQATGSEERKSKISSVRLKSRDSL